MRLISAFFDIALDALFPVPPAEKAVLAMGPEGAYSGLPRANRAPIPDACSLFSYKDERVSRLIWSIKYKKSVAGAAIAGYALSRALRFFNKAIPQDMQIVVVPMPITSARRRERGYNQCDLIINELEKTVEFDVENRITYVRDLLIRVRHTSRQTLKDRTDRLESIHGIFAVNESAASLPEMRRDPLRYFIVVIDDVITTGSTIKDAIKTFRKAGFENTYGLSVAH